MARKPKNANIDIRQTARVFDEQAFVDGMFNGDYILVVGSGVILDRKQFSESGGNINQYIIDEINNDRRGVQTDFIDHKSFTDVYKGTKQGEEDPIFRLLTRDADDGGIEYNLNDISPELTKLLRTRLFKFIVTTTIDNYLETLLRDIWGEKLRVVNIEDHRSITDFNSAYDDKYNQPTLFYIFGKARKKDGSNPRHFVEIDEDAIKCIEKWMQLDEGNKSIVPFLRKKRLLALGCKFDNWYFRFFWYIITRGFGIRDRDGNPNTIDNLAIIFNPNDNSDKNLRDYLTGIDVCMHEEYDVWQFMERIYEMLTSTAIDSPFREMVLSKRREGGIFISYKSCDVLAASSLFCKLARDNDLNVWFDNVNLNVGDPYKHVIHEAIGKAKIFMPILSPTIAKELEKQGESIATFYSNEWRWASKMRDYSISIQQCWVNLNEVIPNVKEYWNKGYDIAYIGGGFNNQTTVNNSVSTYSQNYNVGGYNGNYNTTPTTTRTWKNCSVCYGTGKCKSCNGTGKNSYTTSGNCGVCYGTGKCAGCRGERGYYYESTKIIRKKIRKVGGNNRNPKKPNNFESKRH